MMQFISVVDNGYLLQCFVHRNRVKIIVLLILYRLVYLDLNPDVCRPIGKVFIRGINAMNLPLSSVQKNG